MGPELLSDQLNYNARVMVLNCDGISDEESLSAPQAGGNCLNWVLGHIVATRNRMLGLVGCDPVWNEKMAEPYRRGSQPISAKNATPLAAILEAVDQSQAALLEALSGLSDEDLGGSSSIQFFKGDAETLGSALAAFVFHEAYHVGQTGVLRRVAGHEGAIK